MNTRLTLLLVVVAGGLLAYILAFEFNSLSTGELEKRRGRVLERFVRERVDGLELQRNDQTMKLRRLRDDEDELGAWRLTVPVDDEADEDSVSALLGELEWLDARRVLRAVSDADRTRFGLDTPRQRVWFSAANQRVLLRVGRSEARGEGVYVEIADRPGDVYVVPDSLATALAHEVGHFRTKQFLGEMTIAWARELVLSGETASLRLVREGERWWVEGKERVRADTERVKAWLRSFDDLRATRYATTPGLETSSSRMTLRIVPPEDRADAEERTVQLWLGDVCPGKQAERLARAGEGSPLVCVAENELEKLELSDVNVRERRALAVRPSELEGFSLGSGPGAIELRRDGEQWKPVGSSPEKPDGAQIDRQSVEGWLRALHELKATDSTESTGPSGPASLRVRLSGDLEDALTIGAVRSDGLVRLRRPGEGLSSVFASRLAELLAPSWWHFRSMKPFPEAPEEVTLIVAERGGERVSLARTSEGWQGANGPFDSAMRDAVRRLLEQLGARTAQSFVGQVPAGGLAVLGLDPAPMRLKLGLRDSEGDPLNLRLSMPDPDGELLAVFEDGRVYRYRSALADVVLGFLELSASGSTGGVNGTRATAVEGGDSP